LSFSFVSSQRRFGLNRFFAFTHHQKGAASSKEKETNVWVFRDSFSGKRIAKDTERTNVKVQLSQCGTNKQTIMRELLIFFDFMILC